MTTTGPERSQHGQHLLKVAFGFADVLRAEVAQHDARNADRAGVALGQECFAGADRAAHQVAHRRRFEPAFADPFGVLLQSLLGGVQADDQIERVLRLDELDQTLALPLDHRLLELAEPRGVEPFVGAGRLRERRRSDS